MYPCFRLLSVAYDSVLHTFVVLFLQGLFLREREVQACSLDVIFSSLSSPLLKYKTMLEDITTFRS